jgi:hypothetical protein
VDNFIRCLCSGVDHRDERRDTGTVDSIFRASRVCTTKHESRRLRNSLLRCIKRHQIVHVLYSRS